MLSLNDVIKVHTHTTFSHPHTQAHISTTPHACFQPMAAKSGRVVLLPPALILLMITEGQAARDPCPNIRQIKTTPITGMFAGRINLE